MDNVLPYPEGLISPYSTDPVIKGKLDIFSRLGSAISSIGRQFTYVKNFTGFDYTETFNPYDGYKPTVKRGVQNYQIKSMRATSVNLSSVVLYVDIISLPRKKDVLYYENGATLAIYLNKEGITDIGWGGSGQLLNLSHVYDSDISEAKLSQETIDYAGEIAYCLAYILKYGKDNLKLEVEPGTYLSTSEVRAKSEALEAEKERYRGFSPTTLRNLRNVVVGAREPYVTLDNQIQEEQANLQKVEYALHQVSFSLADTVWGTAEESDSKRDFNRKGERVRLPEDFQEVIEGLSNQVSTGISVDELSRQLGTAYTKFTTDLQNYANYYGAYREQSVHLNTLKANYTGWERYYLVPGGHIHTSSNCSTLHKAGKTTRLTWLTKLSALPVTEVKDMVEETLCSVCYGKVFD